MNACPVILGLWLDLEWDAWVAIFVVATFLVAMLFRRPSPSKEAEIREAIRRRLLNEAKTDGGIVQALNEQLGRHAGAAFSKPVADALTHSNQTAEFVDPPALQPHQLVAKMRNEIIVWVAQGFGSGRLKPGPGTWGSIVGVAWFAGLVATGSLWGFFGGILLSIPLCAWICGEAEKALGEKDPGSVVLDEIIAVPLCFGAWLLSVVNSTGRMPEVSHFFSGNHWLGVAAIFAAFRLFDIWKPWPVRQSQSLPGGWGVTVDDLLAALYVNLVSLLFLIG